MGLVVEGACRVQEDVLSSMNHTNILGIFSTICLTSEEILDNKNNLCRPVHGSNSSSARHELQDISTITKTNQTFPHYLKMYIPSL